MREQLRERVMQVYEITCLEQGNAFLTENNLLITVKHVVAANRLEPESEKPKYPIMLDPGNGKVKIKCEILTQDADNFEDSTLVLLKPEKELTYTCKACDSFLTARGMEVNGYINSIWMSLGIDTSDSKKTEITAYLPHNEATNAQIALKNPLKSFKGLSGSPVVIANTVYGVMIDEIVDGAGCASRAHILCDDEYWRRRDILVNNLSKQEEAMKKAEKPVPSFAEYVADACNDRPNGLRRLMNNVSEYTSQYPGQNAQEDWEKLKAFAYHIFVASNGSKDKDVREDHNKAIEKLNGIYKERKHWQDVYISALFWRVESACEAYDKCESSSNDMEKVRCSEGMENVKRLLGIAVQDLPLENDIHKELHAYIHLFMAEYYVVKKFYKEAEVELKRVSELGKANSNCNSYRYILLACCAMGKGSESDVQEAVTKLDAARATRPTDCRFYMSHTGIYRSMGRFYMERRKFTDALECIEAAFQGDSDVRGSEKGIEKDLEQFSEICNAALDHYIDKGFESYRDWNTIYIRASESAMYSKIADTFKETVWNKWIDAMGQCRYIRTLLKKKVKEQELEAMEFIHLDGSSVDADKLKQEVDSAKNKNLILIERDITADSSDLFEEQRNYFLKLLRKKLAICPELVRSPEKMEDVYLYIYESQPDDNGANRPPVWVLVCRK